MFFAHNQFGADVLSRVFHTLPIDSKTRLKTVSKFLDVTEITLNRWLTGKSNPPRAVVYALWHESHEGRAYVHNHLSNNLATLHGLTRSQQDAISALESTVAALLVELDEAKQSATGRGPANDPIFQPGHPRIMLRPRADSMR